MDLNYHTQLFEETISNFEKMLNEGQINEEEYNSLVTNAYLELQERLAEEIGVEEEDVEEALAATYSDDYESAEFSVGNRFGAALLELGDVNGYTDLEDYIEDLAQITDNSPEDIFDLITGDAVPDNELVLALNEIFELPENYQADLLLAGIEARGEDINDYLTDDEDEEDYEDDEDDEDEENYSRLYELENEIANFQYENLVKDKLAELTEKAYYLVDSGYMPPVVAEKIVGNFNLSSDRIAAFSAVCNYNNVDPEKELYFMEKTLELFETMPQVNFGYYADEEYYTDEELEEEEDLYDIAENYVKEYRKQ